MARVRYAFFLVVAVMAAQAAADSVVNPGYTYSFWRDVKTPNQYYAIATGWRLTFPSDVSRMVACQCAPLVTSADRPAKHGWAHDQSVNNAGVAKGRILSRNAAGASTPDPEAEACMRKILKETYPTLEIVLTVLCTLGPLFLLLVTFVCIL